MFRVTAPRLEGYQKGRDGQEPGGEHERIPWRGKARVRARRTRTRSGSLEQTEVHRMAVARPVQVLQREVGGGGPVRVVPAVVRVAVDAVLDEVDGAVAEDETAHAGVQTGP